MKLQRHVMMLVVCTVLPVSNALAFEFATSLGPGMGKTEMLSSSSASTLVNLPTGGIGEGEWRVETGYSRRFDLGDLDQPFLAVVYRRHDVTAALGISQMGHTDYYAERVAKLSIARHFDSLSVGVMFSGMAVDIGAGYGQLRAASVGLGAAYRRDRWAAVLVADNLTSPRLTDNAVAMEPILSLYTELIGRKAFSVTGRATFQEHERPQFAFGQRIGLSEGSAFFWGLSSAPLEYGGGIELRLAAVRISYATTIHPVLGLSHTIAFAHHLRKREEGGSGID